VSFWRGLGGSLGGSLGAVIIGCVVFGLGGLRGLWVSMFDVF